MAGKVAALPAGRRLTDFISLGVLTKVVPLEEVTKVLEKTGRGSKRRRDLPAQIIVYYVIAPALYIQVSYREVMRCLLEGLQLLFGPGFVIKVASKSSISEARTRLGDEPVKLLHDKLVKPVVTKATKGAFYRKWQVASLDGSVFDVADTPENENEFGRPAANQGISAYPQIRFVSLVEAGTHILFASHMGGCRKTSEQALARTVIKSLKGGMLCIADRLFYSFKLWNEAKDTVADLLWRVKDDLKLPREKELPDGSYLSRIYDSKNDRHRKHGTVVRVIEFTIKKENGEEENYRLITTILGYEQAPALELADLYHERWEIETALDELKTHLRGARIILRSRTPTLVRQEFYGFMLAHYAIRGLMHEAALKADIDPDRLSFLHSKRVVLRKLPQFAAFPPGAMAVSS
jgi:hypothetical protein